MKKTIKIAPADNVVVVLSPIAKGEIIENSISQEHESTMQPVRTLEDIPQGHKIAIQPIKEGEDVIKYGFPIGHASADIAPGAWVHTHNVKTNLSRGNKGMPDDTIEGAPESQAREAADAVLDSMERESNGLTAKTEAGTVAFKDIVYTYQPRLTWPEPEEPETFLGFRRKDGRAAIRNEIWVIPTVGCVNDVAKKLVNDNQDLVAGTIDGLYTFPHPFGCSQTGADHAQTRKLLAALVRHPNAAAVLVLSLGCENLTHEQFLEELGDYDPDRVKFLTCQDVEDEFEEGRALLAQCAAYAARFAREPIPVSELVIGIKCGGSDGLSGITANPTVGRFSDLLIARGGSTVLTEVPEMFGAEGFLMNRCVDECIFEKAVAMINGFKNYFISHGEVIYENPSPGNKAGGITTLEDKSCGCVQKGGTAPIVDVIGYGDPVVKKGLNLLYGPGNDLVSATALTAAGAHMILFTTGRGTPFGAPAPTLKISTNSQLAAKKKGWIDFDAGTIADGEPIDEAARQLLALVIEIASGRQTKSEQHGYREISIFKDGVVL